MTITEADFEYDYCDEPTWDDFTAMMEGPGSSILFQMEIPRGLSSAQALRQFIGVYRQLKRDGAFVDG